MSEVLMRVVISFIQKVLKRHFNLCFIFSQFRLYILKIYLCLFNNIWLRIQILEIENFFFCFK